MLLVLGLARLLAPEPAPGAEGMQVAELDGDPVVTDWAQATAGSPPIRELPRRKRIRHRVRSRERVTQIAARYGVRVDDLIEWNGLEPGQEYPPKGRRSLEVRTHRIAPPRFRVRYVPRAGEGWGDIAAKLRVEGRDLRAWNWQQRHPVEGVPLKAWVDPWSPLTVRPDPGTPVPPADVEVPEGGRSIGRPQRGRLENGVQLPESMLYTRGFTRVLWGSTHTVRTLIEAFAIFRHRTGYGGEVIVGSMSRRTGRRLRPHLSHQSGRDVDIRLPVLPGVPHGSPPNPDEVDWYATWGLVEALKSTGEVSLIFLDVHLQRRLYEAARAMGRTPDDLRGVIQWPFPEGGGLALVRHFDGHDGHIHVRIRCGPDEPRCRPRRRSAEPEAELASKDAAVGDLIDSAP